MLPQTVWGIGCEWAGNFGEWMGDDIVDEFCPPRTPARAGLRVGQNPSAKLLPSHVLLCGASRREELPVVIPNSPRIRGLRSS